jgi:hypothetical protein
MEVISSGLPHIARPLGLAGQTQAAAAAREIAEQAHRAQQYDRRL